MSQISDSDLQIQKATNKLSNNHEIALFQRLDFIQQLQQIMSEPTFRTFFENHFKTWNDTKATLMLINAYLMIDEETNRLTGQQLPPEEIGQMLRQVIMNTQARRCLVDSINAFTDDPNRQQFTQIFRQMITEPTQPVIDISIPKD